MQQNDILREIRDRTAPSFMPQPMLTAHKNSSQAFKFKARNENAFTITGARNSMRDTFYKLIRHNRNNTTQKMQIRVTERFSKPGEVLNEIPLCDSLTGITHQSGTTYIPTNREVEDDKYRQNDVFTLYPRSSIRRLLDNLKQSLIQKREDNMARLKGDSNHKCKYINEDSS